MISDFGLSKMEGKGDVMSTACGTPGYVGKRFAYTVHPLFPAAVQRHNKKEIFVCSFPLDLSNALDPGIRLRVCGIHCHDFNPLQSEFPQRHSL